MLAPLAFLKLQFFLHAGETEIGGFGISRADDLLYIEDFITVIQTTTRATVEFDDGAVADHFDRMVDLGKIPAQFGRIWVHTHPGCSAQPSNTDERTFARVFGRCDWSVMFILARSGQTYARLQLAAGPGATLLLPVRVDWAAWADSLVAHEERMDALTQAWMDEYGQNVRPVIDIPALPSRSRLFDLAPIHPAVIPFDQTRVAHSHVDDPDHIANPEEDWWQIDGELETLVELEAGDYFGTEVLS